MPDAWPTVRAQARPADPALDGTSRSALAADAATAANRLGLQAGGRLLWTRGWSGSADWVSSLLAPMAVGGSVVLVRNPDPDKYQQRVAAERVTVQH